MITVEHLCFDYPGKRALDNVSLRIAERSITALVGPNGAGKTTLLRNLAALETPYSGSITVDGIDVQEDPRGCHRRIGYLSDFFGLYDDLTVARCLSYVAAARQVPEQDIPRRVEETAASLQLSDRLGQRAGELSRGLRQRLAIGQAIIHQPKVLFLDEPASGLDPKARHSLAVLLTGLRDDGMTLMVSSHILAELEAYATDMLVMNDGKITDQRSIGTRLGQHRNLLIRFSADPAGLESLFAATAGVQTFAIDATQATLTFDGDDRAQSELLQALAGINIGVFEVGEIHQSLQDAYLEHIDALRDSE